MPLPHERPSQDYMRELKAVARAAGDLADHLGKVNLLPDGFPIEQVEGFCLALTSLPHGTAEGSIAPLRAADSELNRVRQHYIPTYDEDEDEKEPLVSRGDDFDQRLVGLMAAIRAAIEQYKLESGEELDTDITPDLADVDKANDAITAALEATTKAGTDIKQIDQVISDFDTEQLEHIELEIMLASDAGVQVRSAEAALKTEKPRPTVIGWLSDGVDKTADVLEYRLSKHGKIASQVGQEVGSLVGELLEINFPKIVKSLKVAKTRLSNIVVILSNDGPGELPSDFDYVEVYNRLLRGEMVPDHWAPFVTEINFFYDDDAHHLLDKLDLIEFSRLPEFSDALLLSNLSNLEVLDLFETSISDLTPLQNLKALRTLDLTGMYIQDIRTLSQLTSLRILNLGSTDVSDCRPITNLKELRHLNLDETDVADLSPLAELKSLIRLSLEGSAVTDITPLEKLHKLEDLDLGFTNVTNIAPLADLKKLSKLNLRFAKVFDYSPIVELSELKELYIDEYENNNISELNGLHGLKIILSKD